MFIVPLSVFDCCVLLLTITLIVLISCCDYFSQLTEPCIYMKGIDHLPVLFVLYFYEEYIFPLMTKWVRLRDIVALVWIGAHKYLYRFL